MKLRTYLSEAGISLTRFAAKIGVSVSTVHGWTTGRRVPALETALRIEALTDGRVTTKDLAPVPSKSKAA